MLTRLPPSTRAGDLSTGLPQGILGKPRRTHSTPWPNTLMLNGLHHVWRAAEILASADCGLRGRLQQARTEFLVALEQPDQWPPDLLSVARSIERILRQDGDRDPAETMALALAQQVAEDLLALAVDVLAAFPKQAETDDNGQTFPQTDGHVEALRVLRVELAEPSVETNPGSVSLP